MSWIIQTLSSTLGKKVIMALTGIFLMLFLIVHLAGNLQLLLPDDGKTFNIYAHSMGHNLFIQIVSIGNFSFILLHVFFSLFLTIYNKKARPIGYSKSDAKANSSWNSRNMGILGTLILLFLIVHLKGFWYENKFGFINQVFYEGVGKINNLYLVVKAAYSEWWYVLIYVISMFILAFHLSHGFQSAFRTLGLQHKKYSPIIEKVGLAFSVIVPGLFAMIPIWMFLETIM